MIINLPGFHFEGPYPSKIKIGPFFDIVRQFLDVKGVKRSEYALGNHPTAGFGELVITKINDLWVVFTTEHGTNFDVAVFSNAFHAVNYYIFRLAGEKDTIDWSTL